MPEPEEPLSGSWLEAELRPLSLLPPPPLLPRARERLCRPPLPRPWSESSVSLLEASGDPLLWRRRRRKRRFCLYQAFASLRTLKDLWLLPGNL